MFIKSLNYMEKLIRLEYYELNRQSLGIKYLLAELLVEIMAHFTFSNWKKMDFHLIVKLDIMRF